VVAQEGADHRGESVVLLDVRHVAGLGEDVAPGARDAVDEGLARAGHRLVVGTGQDQRGDVDRDSPAVQ
jgi:hypothetical protein